MVRCLHCNKNLEIHEALDGDTNPLVGDISFCSFCSGLHIFIKGGMIKIKKNTLDVKSRKMLERVEDKYTRTNVSKQITDSSGGANNGK